MKGLSSSISFFFFGASCFLLGQQVDVVDAKTGILSLDHRAIQELDLIDAPLFVEFNQGHPSEPFLDALDVVNKLQIPVVLGKVNANKEWAIAEEYGLNKADFPALVVLKKDAIPAYYPQTYEKNSECLVEYMKLITNMTHVMPEICQVDDDGIIGDGGDNDDSKNSSPDYLSEMYEALSDIEKDGSIYVLDETNFDKVLEEVPLILVEFYASWCAHCKTLAPEYAQAAAALAADGIPLAKVDGEANPALNQRFVRKGFPTVLAFKREAAAAAAGPVECTAREAGELTRFARRWAEPEVRDLPNLAAALAFVEENEVAAIGFFPEDEGVEQEKANAATFPFYELAKAASVTAPAAATTARFGRCTSEYARAFFAAEAGAVVVFKDYDGPRTDIPLVGAEMDQEDFMAEFRLAVAHDIEVFSSWSAASIFHHPTKVHLLIFGDADRVLAGGEGAGEGGGEGAEGGEGVAAGAALRAAGRRLARERRALAVLVPREEQKVLDYFGVPAFDAETLHLMVGDMREENNLVKYAYTGPILEQDIVEFVEAVLAGEVEPYVKSEQLEEGDLEGAVKVVKGASFNSLIMETDKDVLLEFYAPWCGHCTKFEPIYQEVAEKFLGNTPSVLIAKVDATKNDISHPNIKVKGFPSLYFFPGKAKDKPIYYEGERSVEALIEFIQEHASIANNQKGEGGAEDGLEAQEQNASSKEHEEL